MNIHSTGNSLIHAIRVASNREMLAKPGGNQEGLGIQARNAPGLKWNQGGKEQNAVVVREFVRLLKQTAPGKIMLSSDMTAQNLSRELQSKPLTMATAKKVIKNMTAQKKVERFSLSKLGNYVKTRFLGLFNTNSTNKEITKKQAEVIGGRLNQKEEAPTENPNRIWSKDERRWQNAQAWKDTPVEDK